MQQLAEFPQVSWQTVWLSNHDLLLVKRHRIDLNSFNPQNLGTGGDDRALPVLLVFMVTQACCKLAGVPAIQVRTCRCSSLSCFLTEGQKIGVVTELAGAHTPLLPFSPCVFSFNKFGRLQKSIWNLNGWIESFEKHEELEWVNRVIWKKWFKGCNWLPGRGS